MLKYGRIQLKKCYFSMSITLAPYSPLMFPGFDEEEFMNRLDEDEDALEPIPGLVVTPGTEAANLAVEIERTVIEASKERVAEETGVGGGDDADWNSPS